MSDRLQFDPVAHVYSVDGLRVPSVTGILKATGFGGDYAAIPVAVLEAARQRGIAVHGFCEQIDRGEQPVVLAKLQPYVDAYEQCRAETRLEVIETEQAVFHPEMLYAGRFDLVAWVNGARALIDRKVVATIEHLAVAVQTAAYAGARNAMLPQEPVEALYSLHLRQDGSYRLEEYNMAECWEMFRSCHALYRHRQSFKKGRRDGR